MRRKRFRIWFLALLLSLAAAGCGSREEVQHAGKVEGLDKLGEIVVISREEGSGTRSAFAQLADFDNSTEAGKTDGTTESAVVVSDAESVLREVDSRTSAIGYVSMGFLNSQESGKVLSVNGIAGTKENVEKGKYPLSRAFYLAYNGKLNDLEQDFLTFIKGKGQEIVEDAYVPVGKSSTFLSNRRPGSR